MKRPISFYVYGILIMTLLGCQKHTAPPTVSVGSFHVNSNTGFADGQAFGINFKAKGASRAKVNFNLSGNPKQSSSSTITLADDLKIELQTMDEGKSVAFQLNGREICNLAKGDEVVIDEERNVTVNRNPGAKQSASHEDRSG